MPQRHHGTIERRTNPAQSRVGFFPEPAEVRMVSREGNLITVSVINGVWIGFEFTWKSLTRASLRL